MGGLGEVLGASWGGLGKDTKKSYEVPPRSGPFGALLGPILGPFWGHVGVKMGSKAILDSVIFGITFLIAFGKDLLSILEGF